MKYYNKVLIKLEKKQILSVVFTVVPSGVRELFQLRMKNSAGRVSKMINRNSKGGAKSTGSVARAYQTEANFSY